MKNTYTGIMFFLVLQVGCKSGPAEGCAAFGHQDRQSCMLSSDASATRSNGLVLLTLSSPQTTVSLAASKVTQDVLTRATADLAALVQKDPSLGPTMVRLAWHSSGTYDKMLRTGGSQLGTIRFKEELSHGGNAGLDKMIMRLEPVAEANLAMSYADLYTLAGVVAIRELGGPTIPWRAGRKDSMNSSDVAPDDRLRNADNGSPKKDAAHLRKIFYRMGFNDQEIVALSGAHSLGRCHADASGFVGPWTPTPTTFSNLYFSLLIHSEWEEGCIRGATCRKHQYRNVGGQSWMMLPSDIALIRDPVFKKYVDAYANDQGLFFADFSYAFSALLELGTKDLYNV